jgi:hypothetical protein
MSLLNISSIISSVSGIKPLVNNIAGNYNPSNVRLATANLTKGGSASAPSLIGGSASGSLSMPIGGAQLGSISGANDNTLNGVTNNALSNATGILNNANSSLNSTVGTLTGLLGGSASSSITGFPTISFVSDETSNKQASSDGISPDDWRIRIRCPAFNNATVIFPVLPILTINYSANYSSERLTHSNYKSYFYDSSEVQAISIDGDFPIQTAAEGQVLLSAINFFRATTKMFFGTGVNAGNPPPLVFLTGYGKQFMDQIPCLVTSFQHTMPNDVDYINCNGVRLPTASKLVVTLQPVVSRAKAGTFNLNSFANGTLSGFI